MFNNPTVPSAPPSGVESLVLNATSVVLSWRPPARAHTNGRITEYSVWLFVNKTVPHSNLTLNGNLHTLTLYNLTYGEHFTATVAAHTKYVAFSLYFIIDVWYCDIFPEFSKDNMINICLLYFNEHNTDCIIYQCFDMFVCSSFRHYHH